MSIAPTGLDIRFDETRVETGRNFCTKLWNVSRFRQMSGESGDNSSIEKILDRIDPAQLDTDDQAILGQLAATQDKIAKGFEHFQFNAIAQSLYSFIWNDLCDWYVKKPLKRNSKIRLRKKPVSQFKTSASVRRSFYSIHSPHSSRGIMVPPSLQPRLGRRTHQGKLHPI